MGTLQDKLWKIVEKAGQGRPLSEEELSFVEGCLGAPDPGDLTNACEAILRASDSPRLRNLALTRLEGLSGNASEEDYAVTLLSTLLYVPADDIISRATLKDFVFASALSRRWAIRTNAVSVLERIAHKGDREALLRIKQLAEDANDYVQANARSSLERLVE